MKEEKETGTNGAVSEEPQTQPQPKRKVHKSKPIDTGESAPVGGEKPAMDSFDAEERLVKVMNDSPTLVKLGKHGFPVTALKPGTQMLIAEEACRIVKVEKANFADVIRQFAMNFDSVIKVITLAILNDRDRIFADERRKIYSDEFESMCSTIRWETNPAGWMGLLVEVMNLLNMDFFFSVTETIKILREMTLKRKTTIQEQRSSAVAPNGGR